MADVKDPFADYLSSLDDIIGTSDPKEDEEEGAGEESTLVAVKAVPEKSDRLEGVVTEAAESEPDPEVTPQPQPARSSSARRVYGDAVSVAKPKETPAEAVPAHPLESKQEAVRVSSAKKVYGEAVPISGKAPVQSAPSSQGEVPAESKPARSEKTSYVFSSRQISDSAVQLPGPMLKVKVEDPSVGEMKEIEEMYRASARPFEQDSSSGGASGLFDDSVIIDFGESADDLKVDIGYDEAKKIRELFDSIKDLTPAELENVGVFEQVVDIREDNTFEEVSSASKYDFESDMPAQDGGQKPSEPSGASGFDIFEDAPVFDDMVAVSSVPNPFDTEIVFDTFDEEELASVVEPPAAEPVGYLPLLMNQFASDAEESVGKSVLTPVDATVIGYDIKALLTGTLLKVRAADMEGTIIGDECVFSYNSITETMTATVEIKHGRGLLSEAANERGEMPGHRISRLKKDSKKIIKEEIATFSYETVGELLPMDVKIDFARIIFEDVSASGIANNYMVVMSAKSPEIGVSWDRTGDSEPVQELAEFTRKLSSDLNFYASRDMSQLGQVVARSENPSTERAYQCEVFEIGADGKINYVFPERARQVARQGS